MFIVQATGGQSSNEYLNVVHFFNTGVNTTSVAAQDNGFPTLVSNSCCSVVIPLLKVHYMSCYITFSITVMKTSYI